MNRRRGIAVCGIGIGLGFVIAGLILRPYPLVLYNPSESAELGWYRVYPGREFGRGSLVAARLPEGASVLADARGYLPDGMPVIKTIGAVGGDQICWSETDIVLPSDLRLPLLERDSAGRVLRSQPRGCIVLHSGEVFLVSTRTTASFDSRYFGPVDASAVIGPVRFLGSDWGEAVRAFFDVRDQGRRAGYCKIKARSADPGSEPCLHIVSSSAIRHSAAPRFYPYALYRRDYWQRYFTDGLRASRNEP